MLLVCSLFGLVSTTFFIKYSGEGMQSAVLMSSISIPVFTTLLVLYLTMFKRLLKRRSLLWIPVLFLVNVLVPPSKMMIVDLLPVCSYIVIFFVSQVETHQQRDNPLIWLSGMFALLTPTIASSMGEVALGFGLIFTSFVAIFYIARLVVNKHRQPKSTSVAI